MRALALRALLVLLGVLPLAGVVAVERSQPAYELATQCPPSFEKTGAGVCRLRTLYEFYNSVQGHGVGGTQTSLPGHRDGFTPEQIDLGRYLFFDPVLSGDGTLSCASCHHPDKGFTDNLPRAVGVGDRQAPRAAPTLWNVAFLKSFNWDARAHSLEEQVLGPLYSDVEMGNNPQQLLQSLNAIAAYRSLFAQAFPGQDVISLDQLYTALAAFQASLVSLNSRYDRYVHGYHDALTPREIEGMNVFRSFVARCAECHMPPLFTTQQVAVIGAPEPEGLPLDVGAEKTFNAPKLKAGFKVPTLRNIALTAPYMHSGVFDNLRDASEFYNKGRGHAVPEGVELHLHWHITSPDLTDDEVDRLVDFMGALTDESLKPAIPGAVPSGLTPVTHRAEGQATAVPAGGGDEAKPTATFNKTTNSGETS